MKTKRTTTTKRTKRILTTDERLDRVVSLREGRTELDPRRRTKKKKTTTKRPSKKSATFTIEMGQGFKYVLPDAIRAIGGRVWWTRLDSSTTLVYVRATFYGKTSRDVQDALWERWPMVSIGVSENVPDDLDAYSVPDGY